MLHNSPTVERSLDAIGESPTLAVEQEARALRRAGRSIVSFAAGEPDFATPAHVVEAAIRACRDPRAHHYSATHGSEALRAAIVRWTQRTSGLRREPAEILVTNGAKQAIHHAFAALCAPGDEAIVPVPHWPTYVAAARLAGATPVLAACAPETGWTLDVERLEALRTARTRVLVLCSPANPTGAVATAEQLGAIGGWAARHGIWVLADEIYGQLVYDGASAPSLPAVAPELRDRCVVVNGVSKAYAMTGWRVGWLAGPVDVVRRAERLQGHVTSNVNNVAQQAALAALEGEQRCVEAMHSAYERRRTLLLDALLELDGVACVEPRGAFYVFPSFAEHLGRTLRGCRVETTIELAGGLLRQAGVAIVAGEAFGLPRHARLSFALADDQIVEGVERMRAFLAGR